MTNTTYYLGGLIAAAPAQNRATEADSVTATFTTWDQAGNQTSQRALTAAEAAEFAAVAAEAAADANGTTLTARAQAALAANATFQALAAPTAAQTLAQVQLLTKECNALIRLATRLFDSTSGT